MALKLDITDSKGVKTRYHKVKSFEVKDGKVIVTVSGYVNQAMRDYEKNATENNDTVEAYRQETERLQELVDAKSAELANNQDNQELHDEVVRLSNDLNARHLNPDKPVFMTPEDKYYTTEQVEINYFEPLSYEGIYGKLLELPKYSGAEKI